MSLYRNGIYFWFGNQGSCCRCCFHIDTDRNLFCSPFNLTVVSYIIITCITFFLYLPLSFWNEALFTLQAPAFKQFIIERRWLNALKTPSNKKFIKVSLQIKLNTKSSKNIHFSVWLHLRRKHSKLNLYYLCEMKQSRNALKLTLVLWATTVLAVHSLLCGSSFPTVCMSPINNTCLTIQY